MTQDKRTISDEPRGDFIINAVSGKIRHLQIDHKPCGSLLLFLASMTLDIPGDMGDIVKMIMKQGIKLSTITSRCVSDLKRGGELPDCIYEELMESMASIGTTPRRLYNERRYGLSNGAFNQLKINTNKGIVWPDIEGSIRAELVKTLPKCRTAKDFQRAVTFCTLADDSPLLREILYLGTDKIEDTT